MPKFKVPLQKDILQVGEVMVGYTSFYIQGIQISIHDLVSMQHGKVGCLLIVNSARHLLIYLEDILVLGHGEGPFYILKYLELHKIILRDQ